MRTVTVDEVMSWGPCKSYDRARVKSLFAGRESLTAADIEALDIRLVDRLWVLIEMMPSDRERRLFAADCAEAALLDEAWGRGDEIDDRLLAAIDCTRRFAYGETDAREIEAARRNAADAAWDVPWDVSRKAARDALMDVPRYAATKAAASARDSRVVRDARATGEVWAAQLALALRYVES